MVNLPNFSFLMALILAGCQPSTPVAEPVEVQETVVQDESAAPSEPIRQDFEMIQRSEKPRNTADPAFAKPRAKSNAEFGADLYARLRQANPKQNIVFSPHSISVAMGMLAAASEGETLDEISKTMRFDDKTNIGFNSLDAELAKTASTLRVANLFWMGKTSNPSPAYLDELAVNYDAGVGILDFSQSPEPSRQIINQWVEKETERLITNLLPPASISPDTEFVISNAVYFKGVWLNKFKPAGDQTFFAPTGSKKAPFMENTGSYAWKEVNEDLWIEVPYQGEDMSLILMLPADSDRIIKAEDLATLPGTSPARAVLKMPLFKMDFGVDLVAQFKEMGVRRAFGGGEFPHLGPVNVSGIYHKAFIQVDETGTEAAAATAIVVSRSAPAMPKELVLDRTFHFFLRHNPTGAILFMGLVTDPTSN